MRPPLQPNIASSSATVAPLFAARVATILRKPCADPETPASRQASRNRFPNELFSQRLARFANDETQIAARSGCKCCREHRQNRKHYSLFSLDCCYAIADVLTAKAHGVSVRCKATHQATLAAAFRLASALHTTTSSSDHGGKPSLLGRRGASTSAVGSTFTNFALAAQRKSPRIALRKHSACAGVAARRSRPAAIVADVIRAKC